MQAVSAPRNVDSLRSGAHVRLEHGRRGMCGTASGDWGGQGKCEVGVRLGRHVGRLDERQSANMNPTAREERSGGEAYAATARGESSLTITRNGARMSGSSTSPWIHLWPASRA